MPALNFRFHRGGIHLPQLRLWLDPHEPQTGPERVFISHAHSDHVGLHREVILTEATSKLMRARLSGDWIEQILPFGTAHPLESDAGPVELTLLPAGHIFGSAMAYLQSEKGSLLYTGDFKLRPGLSAEPCEPRPADVLIMETTYGRPAYRFPPTADVLQGVIRFCREALDNEETPVLLGYSLGKSQELLCGLAEADLPIMLHGQIHKLTRIYQEFGQSFPPYEKYSSDAARLKVLLCPPSVARSAMLRNLGPVRLAVLTGWAVDPNCRFRYGADAAFPLSDHADFPELLEMVKRVNPKKVFTLHGFASDFAQTLRDLGVDAQALSQEEQLALPLAFGTLQDWGEKANAAVRSGRAVSSNAASPVREPEAGSGSELRESPDPQAAGSFHAFAETCARIGATPRKLEKIELLAGFLKTLGQSELGLVNTWFTGRPFAAAQNKVLQLGWSLIREALCAVAGLDHSEFGQVYLKHSDLGETASEILSRNPRRKPVLTLSAVQTLFDQLHAARGPTAKLPFLIEALRQCEPLEAKYLIKILTGDLRIGLKEGLLEEAIGEAFRVPLSEVKQTNLLLGNIAETAQLASRGELASATLVPFRPIKLMLASPEENAADIWKRVEAWHANPASRAPAETDPRDGVEPLPLPAPDEPLTAWVEDKYDGIRCQLHKVEKRVALYSRDLKEITPTFLDLADAAAKMSAGLIIDGEIVAARGGQILPFSELQKRLGRREGDLFLGEEIPVQFVVFDLLWLNGMSLLKEPMRRRRHLLETIPDWPASFNLAQIQQVSSPAQIEVAFNEARARGNEGLMIKDPMSGYTPGRRGLAWLKLKKAYATLDCVVVGAEYGHGKRKAVLSDYTFAVRDSDTGELKTIGKAYSGLTDAEIAELTQHFLARTISQRGRYHVVEPDVVLEIAFDVIQPSNRHNSGLALRFPRIVRIRTDKTVADIDTLETARALVQTHAKEGPVQKRALEQGVPE